MLNIALLEDNPVHLTHLQNTLQTVLPEQANLSSFSDSETFLAEMRKNKEQFDLAIMDIELGENSGIQTAQTAEKINPHLQIIFISQYLDYISPVYEAPHLYFIYKPDLNQYLKPAIEKACTLIHELKTRILDISWNREPFHILEKNIIYMERSRRTTTIYTETNTYHTSEKLIELLPRLKSNFIRCHQSFIVNTDYVSAFHSSCLILSDGNKIPISKQYQKSVMEDLNRCI